MAQRRPSPSRVGRPATQRGPWPPGKGSRAPSLCTSGPDVRGRAPALDLSAPLPRGCGHIPRPRALRERQTECELTTRPPQEPITQPENQAQETHLMTEQPPPESQTKAQEKRTIGN